MQNNPNTIPEQLPELQLNERALRVVRSGERVALVCNVNFANEIRMAVEQFLERVGLSRELVDNNRQYHVSLANLTGSIHASIARPWE